MTLGSNMTERAQMRRVAERNAELTATCCCCGHSLGSHIGERGGWRCHSLGPDAHQCECYLRKGRYKDIYGYWLEGRVKEGLDRKRELRSESKTKAK